MNKKAILIASLILGLVVLVPLVAAAPSLTQNRDGIAIQDRDQDRTNCDGSCYNGAAANECQQNQTCTQDRQCLQTPDCNEKCDGVCDSDGICDGTQTQTRQCQQECVQNGNINTQHRNCNQNRCGQ